MPTRNKTAGTKLEQQVVTDIGKLFELLPFDNTNYDEATIGRTAAFSRILDGQGVDIWMKDMLMYIQCKNMSTRPNYHELIEKMPDDKMRVVVHNYTKKAKKNFITQGQYATLRYDDFLTLLEYAKERIKEEND